MCNVFDVAKIICEKSEWTVTNLQLQKILYIAQVLYLGFNEKPLFSAKFEAWDYGPVAPVVYREFKMFGNKPIEKWAFPQTENKCGEDKKEFISGIAERALQLRTSQLVGLTHREHTGWQKRYGCADDEISVEDMANEFKNVWMKDDKE